MKSVFALQGRVSYIHAAHTSHCGVVRHLAYTRVKHQSDAQFLRCVRPRCPAVSDSGVPRCQTQVSRGVRPRCPAVSDPGVPRCQTQVSRCFHAIDDRPLKRTASIDRRIVNVFSRIYLTNRHLGAVHATLCAIRTEHVRGCDRGHASQNTVSRLVAQRPIGHPARLVLCCTFTIFLDVTRSFVFRDHARRGETGGTT